MKLHDDPKVWLRGAKLRRLVISYWLTLDAIPFLRVDGSPVRHPQLEPFYQEALLYIALKQLLVGMDRYGCRLPASPLAVLQEVLQYSFQDCELLPTKEKSPPLHSQIKEVRLTIQALQERSFKKLDQVWEPGCLLHTVHSNAFKALDSASWRNRADFIKQAWTPYITAHKRHRDYLQSPGCLAPYWNGQRFMLRQKGHNRRALRSKVTLQDAKRTQELLNVQRYLQSFTRQSSLPEWVSGILPQNSTPQKPQPKIREY